MSHEEKGSSPCPPPETITSTGNGNGSINKAVPSKEVLPNHQQQEQHEVEVQGDRVVGGQGGRLIPLKTTLETRAGESLLNVYITSVPVKQASGSLDIIRKLIPNDGGLDLQHLRRFAKGEHVPEHVRDAFSRPRAGEGREEEMGLDELEQGSGKENGNAKAKASPTLFLIIGSTNLIPEHTIAEALSTPGLEIPPPIRTIQVPLLAPTSAEQAARWTTQYWPTVYKKSNPFGPHPSLVSRVEEEIVEEVTGYMEIARGVGREAFESGCGEGVGVVVVERMGGVGRVVAAAGDGRWDGWFCSRDEARSGGGGGGGGNTTAHAAMRAIGMVAESLRTRNSLLDTTSPSQTSQKPQAEEIFKDTPHHLLELLHYSPTGNSNSYLCHDLEIYCTHEPCVMCAMAIVHSRFGRLIFEKRMRGTGGVCADDGGLGHGLWWRKELNWTMLAWRWVGDGGEEEGVDEELNA